MTSGRSIPCLRWDVESGRTGPSSPVWRVILLVSLCAATGCDSESFTPPRPAELTGGSPAVAAPTGGAAAAPAASPTGLATTTRAIELVAPPHSPPDLENMKTKARAMAGLEKLRIQVAAPTDAGKGDAQAALVRTALGRKPQVLIVEPADSADAELAKAVAEARAQGVTVLLMGRTLAPETSQPAAASAGKGRLIPVLPEPFSNSAKQIVEATLNNAKNAGFGPDGGAILVNNTQTDDLAEDRIKALHGAFRDLGIKPVKELKLAGDLDALKKELKQVLEANPKIGIVVSNDQNGMTASFQTMSDVAEGRTYVLAGYTTDDSSGTMTRNGEFAAAAIYSSERLLRKTIMTAASVVRGEKVPDRVELMVSVNVSPREAGAPRMQRMMVNQRNASKVTKPAPPGTLSKDE